MPVQRFASRRTVRGGASGRDALAGFLRFVNTGKHWRLRLLDSTARLREVLLRESFAGYDGILMDYPSDPTAVRQLSESGIPVVFTHFESTSRDVVPSASFVRLDDESVGRAAADYFLKLGKFGSFVFVAGAPGREEWSIRRERGFRTALGARRIACHTIELPPDAMRGRMRPLRRNCRGFRGQLPFLPIGTMRPSAHSKSASSRASAFPPVCLFSAWTMTRRDTVAFKHSPQSRRPWVLCGAGIGAADEWRATAPDCREVGRP